MGDWIKENKFEAGLMLVVVIVTIVAVVVGGSLGSKYEMAQSNFEIETQSIKKKHGLKPSPTPAGVKGYTEAVESYRKDIKDLQTKLLTNFDSGEIVEIGSSAFSSKLTAARTKLAASLEEAQIEYPSDKWHLGFGQYLNSPPKDRATGHLAFQLDAITWLHEALVAAKPSALLNLYRPELEVEKSAAPEEEESTGRSKRRNRGKKAAEPVDPFTRMPVEITLRGSEPAIREFLKSVSGNDKHYFVIRSLRLQNTKPNDAPSTDDVEFDEVIPDDGFPEDNFDDVGEDPGAPGIEGEGPGIEGEGIEGEDDPVPFNEPAGGDSSQVLGQVLGGEELVAFLALDLILFHPEDQVEALKEKESKTKKKGSGTRAPTN